MLAWPKLPVAQFLALVLIAGSTTLGLGQTAVEGTKQDSETPSSLPAMGSEQDNQAPPPAPAAAPSSPPAKGTAAQQLPSMGSETSPLPSRGYLGEPRDKWNVFVLGDLLAEGVWAGLGREGVDSPFNFNGRFKEDSGLARPEIYNWEKALPKILDSNDVNVAVIIIGTNDGRPIRTETGRVEFGTPEWREAYAAAIDRFIAILKQNDTAIYWLGVPPMGSPEHDEAVKLINEVQKERAAANGLRFLDFRKLFADENGNFTAIAMDETGAEARVRSRDGISLLRPGNTKAALAVLAALNDDAAVANGEKPVAAAPMPSGGEAIAAAMESPPPSGPQFGGVTAGGDVRLVAPEDLPQKGLASVARENAALTAVKSKLSPGTAAGNLYNDGVWPEAQAGRVDDFAWSGR